MRTTHHPLCHVLSLVGIGLMLAGLFGGLTLPATAAAGVEPFASQIDWRAQSPYGYRNPSEQRDYWQPHNPWRQHDHWGPRDHWGYRHDRQSPRSRYGLPDRYTIHKGRKCEVQCERIWGTRNYSCREYRC